MRREVLEHNLVAGGVGRLPDSEDEDKEVQHYLLNSHVACSTEYMLPPSGEV